MGVIDHQKKSIGWINELQRSTILTARSASCSFYVPMLIPIVVALTQDCSSVESEKENASNNTDQRVLLSIIAGSVEFNEIINVNDSTFRLYGSRISTTGFKGSEFALVASEEIVEITICDVATEKVLASFEYKHLYSDDIPQGMDVDAIDYDGSSIPFNTISLEGNNASTAPSPSVKLNEAVEVDELIDSDVEIIMGDGRGDSTPKKAAEGQRRLVIPSLYPRVFPKQPESPSLDPGRLGGLLGRSFQPLLKPMHRCREPKLKVKAETSGEEGSLPSGGKTVSPPHYIRKDTVAKVDDIQAKIKVRRAMEEKRRFGPVFTWVFPFKRAEFRSSDRRTWCSVPKESGKGKSSMC